MYQNNYAENETPMKGKGLKVILSKFCFVLLSQLLIETVFRELHELQA